MPRGFETLSRMLSHSGFTLKRGTYMKKDQKVEMRNQDKEALNKRLVEISKELITQKMDYVMGKLKNVHIMKKLKKERAFIMTVLGEKGR